MSQANPWGTPVIATPPPPPPTGWMQPPAQNLSAPTAPTIVYELWGLKDVEVPFQGFPPGTPLSDVSQMWNKPIGTMVRETRDFKIGEYATKQEAFMARGEDPDMRYEVREALPKLTVWKPCPYCGEDSENGQIHSQCIPKFFAQARESNATAFKDAEEQAKLANTRQGPPNPLLAPKAS